MLDQSGSIPRKFTPEEDRLILEVQEELLEELAPEEVLHSLRLWSSKKLVYPDGWVPFDRLYANTSRARAGRAILKLEAEGKVIRRFEKLVPHHENQRWRPSSVLEAVARAARD